MNFAARVSNWVGAKLPVNLVYTRLDDPLASVTFDDFPRSAWTTGGPILEKFQVRATYYVAGGFCGGRQNDLEQFTAGDLQEVHAAGHEIGGHTFSHQSVQTLSSHALVTDADRNAAFVQEVLGDVWLSSFAYPFGAVSPRTKVLLSRRFPTCRGNHPGLNRGAIDLAQLRAVPLYSQSCPPDEIERLVAKARLLKGWIIFYTHDVSHRPTPWGCTPDQLEHVLDALQRAGIDVLPVKHALARMTFRPVRGARGTSTRVSTIQEL